MGIWSLPNLLASGEASSTKKLPVRIELNQVLR